MKIELHEIESISIETFADRHGLVMQVYERKEKSLPRYYAHFKGAECKQGTGFLEGVFGDGSNPEEAISNYAEAISLRTLVIDAMKKSRREIEVPKLHNKAK